MRGWPLSHSLAVVFVWLIVKGQLVLLAVTRTEAIELFDKVWIVPAYRHIGDRHGPFDQPFG